MDTADRKNCVRIIDYKSPITWKSRANVYMTCCICFYEIGSRVTPIVKGRESQSAGKRIAYDEIVSRLPLGATALTALNIVALSARP